jgi:hypothetical protein
MEQRMIAVATDQGRGRGRTALRHRAARASGYSPGEIALQAWGDRDFRVTDSDGYYIRVSQGRAIATPERAPSNEP